MADIQTTEALDVPKQKVLPMVVFWVVRVATSVSLKMEAVHSSGNVRSYKFIQNHNPEDQHLNLHCYENLNLIQVL
jgi:hypothetical protein